MGRRVCQGALLTLLALLSTSSVGAVSAPRVWVIVHRKSPVVQLSRGDLALIYTASKRFWPNGAPIVAFNSPPKTSSRKRFDQAVLNMSAVEAGRYWVQQRVRGHARPPRIAPSARVAISIVKRLPNSIAYVQSPTAPEGVRVVAVVEGETVIEGGKGGAP